MAKGGEGQGLFINQRNAIKKFVFDSQLFCNNSTLILYLVIEHGGRVFPSFSFFTRQIAHLKAVTFGSL